MGRQSNYRPMSAREIIRILNKNGFIAVRQSGSHRSFYNRRTKKLVVIPIHKGKDLPAGTVRSIFKQSGLADKDFQK